MKKRELSRMLSAWIMAWVLGLGNSAFAQTAYEVFAGYAVDTRGAAVVGARVSVNQVSATTGADGYFELSVPAKDKYLINAAAARYVPYSKVSAGPGMQDMRLQLELGQTFTITPQQPVTVTDSQGTRVSLPAGALVDASGKQPSGSLLMTVHTYDLRNEELVGDLTGLDVNGQTVMLQSAGAVSVDFTDSAGNAYNLAPGKKATLSVLADPGSPSTGSVPMWWYDTARGLWIEEGAGLVQDGVATADVSHFTAWNFSINLTSPSCVRINVPSSWWSSFVGTYGEMPRIRVTLQSPWSGVYNLPFNQSGNHVIYNLPNNANLQVERWAPPAWIPYTIVSSGGPWGGTGQPSLSQYAQCQGTITLGGVATAGKVLGRVYRQHRSAHGGSSVQVVIGNSTFSTTTDIAGNFTVMAPAGTAWAKASRQGYLAAQRSPVTVTAGGAITLPNVTLLAGDVDTNTCITTTDMSAINNVIGSAASANDTRNINGDTVIYFNDLSLAAANGGLCGPRVW